MGPSEFVYIQGNIPLSCGQGDDLAAVSFHPGEILGQHQGITGYTIGQRKGLGIAVGRPIYVTRIDAPTNTVFVGDEEELYHDACLVSDPNWIGAEGVDGSLEALVRIRAKDRRPPPLVIESGFVRDAAKWGNVVGIPLLLALYAAWRLWRRRLRARERYAPGGLGGDA